VKIFPELINQQQNTMNSELLMKAITDIVDYLLNIICQVIPQKHFTHDHMNDSKCIWGINFAQEMAAILRYPR
jgi:hypothetical protein